MHEYSHYGAYNKMFLISKLVTCAKFITGTLNLAN